MELSRKPFQGVSNIVRFNWHFYLIATLVVMGLVIVNETLLVNFHPYSSWLLLLGVLPIVISLVVSYFVYDLSDLYQFRWLSNLNGKTVLNINAGFDETSAFIKAKNPNSILMVCDFYDPNQHTEVSIQRARKLYPPFKGTIQVNTKELPFLDNAFDVTVAILSAHEIRNEEERIHFFKELNRVTKEDGQIMVTEHLRDLNNFLAYTIGFLHFYSKASWLNLFKKANLLLKEEIKTTPFISTFILENNGHTL
ncbi:MAG: methyltransferase domain-containing protein [Saprospiraceae bacterium]|nr:methyltransferase domain-containing protein [Saprospiraceae bacterium]